MPTTSWQLLPDCGGRRDHHDQQEHPQYEEFSLPGTQIIAPNVVFSLMPITEKTDDDDVRELVRTARDAGINSSTTPTSTVPGSTTASAASPRRCSSRRRSAPSSRSRRRPASPVGPLPIRPRAFNGEVTVLSPSSCDGGVQLEAEGVDAVGRRGSVFGRQAAAETRVHGLSRAAARLANDPATGGQDKRDSRNQPGPRRVPVSRYAELGGSRGIKAGARMPRPVNLPARAPGLQYRTCLATL